NRNSINSWKSAAAVRLRKSSRQALEFLAAAGPKTGGLFASIHWPIERLRSIRAVELDTQLCAGCPGAARNLPCDGIFHRMGLLYKQGQKVKEEKSCRANPQKDPAAISIRCRSPSFPMRRARQ